MHLNTVIFDMDGLLIDSEPCWQEAGMETLASFDITLTLEQYHHTTGLRTKEWIDYWFSHFNVDKKFAQQAEEDIHRLAIEKIAAKGVILPGVKELMTWCRDKKLHIGLATSSPLALVDVVVEKLGIRSFLEAITSASELPYGKPHPQVYLNCVKELGTTPLRCVAFEDSFNGMIAAKAARLKCVVVPAADQQSLPKWQAADLKLSSLLEFGEAQWNYLNK